MTATTVEPPLLREEFRHEAFLYAGESEFLAGMVPFVREAVEAGEPVLVVVGAPRIAALRDQLGAAAEHVHFADMSQVGLNPARIIPAWRSFLDQHAAAGRRLRGIGEPIWAGRSPAELVECQRHEALLNVAFAGSAPWWLLCPYDAGALGPDVLEEAHRSHPYVRDAGGHRASRQCRPELQPTLHQETPLPQPSRLLGELDFGLDDLGVVRSMIETLAGRFEMAEDRTRDLVVAVHEIATNSLRHGGGRGTLRVWRDGQSLICEISDAGRILDPLAGRERPSLGATGGRGLWLANQLCDLVQIRLLPDGGVVRLHMSLFPR